jgi:GTP-binding protein HflX
VLAEIGAESVPQLLVYNKIDLSGGEPEIVLDECGRIARVMVSARTGDGLSELRSAIAGFAAEKYASQSDDLSDDEADIRFLSH